MCCQILPCLCPQSTNREVSDTYMWLLSPWGVNGLLSHYLGQVLYEVEEKVPVTFPCSHHGYLWVSLFYCIVYHKVPLRLRSVHSKSNHLQVNCKQTGNVCVKPAKPPENSGAENITFSLGWTVRNLRFLGITRGRTFLWKMGC